jgi:hypothetical protein
MDKNSRCGLRGPGPPRPTIEGLRQRGLQVDSAAPDYDPLALLRAGAGPFDVWAAERRDERWATAVEGRLRARLEADLPTMLGEAVERQEVSGRSACCKIVTVLPVTRGRALGRALHVVPFGDGGIAFDSSGVEELEGGRVRYAAVIFFRAWRDLDLHAREYPAWRARHLAIWRERLALSAEDRLLIAGLPDC